MAELEGKVVAITGASRGLGRELARGCIAAGARVVAMARPSASLDETARLLSDACLPLPTDISDRGSVAASFERIAESLGRLDALVNNAAYYYPVDVERSDPERIERHVATNLLGATWCMRSALPLLRESRGHIVNISSVSVRLTPPMLSVYAATKAALETLSSALTNELKTQGVRMTVLRLGAISGSSASQGWDSETTAEFMEALSTAPRVGGTPVDPEVVADALVKMLALPREARLNLVDLTPSD